MNPLTREEFQDTLKKGLGRAVQHVKNSPPESVREDLLYACLHNVACDPLTECSRAPWLYEMIRLSGEMEFYKQEIFDTYFKSSNEPLATWDSRQLFQLLGQFFIHGDPQAGEEVYRIFDWQCTNEKFHGYVYSYAVDEIIEADGIAGLIHIIDRLGHCIHNEEYVYLSPHLLVNAEEKFGLEAVKQALQIEATRNEFVRLYLEHPETQANEENDAKDETDEQRQERMREEYPLRNYVDSFLAGDYSHFKNDEQRLKYRHQFSIAGTWANEEDLDYAFDKMISTDNPLRKTILLMTFYYRPFPRMEASLLELLDSEYEYLAWTVGVVFSQSSHALIREKSLKALESNPPQKNWFLGFKWAENSFQREDVPLLETSLLTKKIPNDHDLEIAGIHLKSIYKRLPGEHFKTIFLWLYEHNPCSYCREEIVEILIENHWITPEILEECRNDCDSDTRELAEKQLALS